MTLTAVEPRPLPTRFVEPATTNPRRRLRGRHVAGFRLLRRPRAYDGDPIETALVDALASAIQSKPMPQPGGGTSGTLGEGLGPEPDTSHIRDDESALDDPPSMGVVTPHNAQCGALDAVLPDTVTADTAEKYQGGKRDIITVSATVSDPQFTHKEERFILNPRRLLVAISRSKLLTVVVCSTALFEVAPPDSERLNDGPLWAQLFTQVVGRGPEPAWAGPLGEFLDAETEHADVPVQVSPSDIDVDGGKQ
jgi:hypothetical protein